jgi:hypothetical protein
MEQENKSNEFKEVTKELIGWEDNKLIRTLKGLTISPGLTIKSYCGSDKQKYLSPIVYFIGVTAIETYIASFIGLFDFILKKNLEDLKRTTSDATFNQFFDTEKVSAKVYEYLAFMTSETGQKIFIIPLFLLLTWLFYKKFNKSFKENSWFAFYTLGHGTLLSIPLMLIWYLSNDLVLYSSVSLILLFIYWVWSSKQFYNLTLRKAIVVRLFMTITALVTLNLFTFFAIGFFMFMSKR